MSSLLQQFEKMMTKAQKLDVRYWYYLLGAFLFLIVMADYFFIMKPQLGTLNKLNPEIKVLSDNLKRTQTDITRISQYKTQVEALKKAVEELRLRVRTKQEVPFIIEKISRIAHQHDVKIDQIMPNTLAQEITLENDDRTYYDLPIIIEARSTYHDFGRFINELESEETFFQVEGLTVSSMAGSRLNVVKVTMSTIVYEEN